MEVKCPRYTGETCRRLKWEQAWMNSLECLENRKQTTVVPACESHHEEEDSVSLCGVNEWTSAQKVVVSRRHLSAEGKEEL